MNGCFLPLWLKKQFYVNLGSVDSRGGVEDTWLEAKAKNTKKYEAKAKNRNARGRGQGPRTQMQVFF